MARRRRDIIAGVAALTTFITGCGPGPSDDERRAEWEANEPHAYAYWFWWSYPEGVNCSVRIEIVAGTIVRTDLGPEAQREYPCEPAPTIDDVFGLLRNARRDVAGAGEIDGAELDVGFGDLGYPDDVGFDSDVPDWTYGFGVAGFEVIEARPPDG